MGKMYKVIGSRQRASARYAMILNRLNNTDKDRNKGYKGKTIDISKEEFVNWFMENDFEGCSVDRIDNSKGYTMDNIQLIPMITNNIKDREKIIDGKKHCYKCNEYVLLENMVKSSRIVSGYDCICRNCEKIRYLEKKLKRSTGK